MKNVTTGAKKCRAPAEKENIAEPAAVQRLPGQFLPKTAEKGRKMKLNLLGSWKERII